MNNTIKFSVNSKNSGQRLDIFLTENINDFTRTYLKKLITSKQVKINGSTTVSPSAKVKYNDQILINRGTMFANVLTYNIIKKVHK